MPFTIDRYREGDRPAVDALYARVFGDAIAESYRRRWEWMYLQNPNLSDRQPVIWMARDGAEIVGQYATMPVVLAVNGVEIDAAWGMDVMVSPDRQRTGLGRVLFDTWDRNTGAAIGLGLTEASDRLFQKLKWPDMGRVPRLVKPLSRRFAAASGEKTSAIARLTASVARTVSGLVPRPDRVREIDRFDERFTRLWERVAPRFAFIVRRDAAYLNWKFVSAPHVRYVIGALEHEGEIAGYAVIRHADDAKWRVTILVDFLADPSDATALATLLRWVEGGARGAGADLVRVATTHRAYIDALVAAGYRVRDPAMRFVAKINAVQVPADYYASADRWHVTFGDSDVDR